MKKLLCIAAMLLPMCSLMAQNSLIYKAQAKFDEGKMDEAWAAIEPALTSGKTKNLAGAYNFAGVIQGKILSAEITKAAQKQPLDTMKFINALDKSVEYFEKSYKLDNAPNEKGKIKPKYNNNAEAPFQSNTKMISQMMNYYAYAGQFLNANGNQKGAYDAFEKFIEMPNYMQ